MWPKLRALFSVLSLTCAALVTLPATAALVLYEPYAYPVGDFLDGTEGAVVSAGGKTATNGSRWFPAGYNSQTSYNALAGTQIVDLNLAVAGLKEPTGNAVWYGGGGYSTRVGIFPINGGTVYASFAFRIFDITGLPAVGGIVAGFNNTPGPQSNVPTVIDSSVWVRPTPNTTDNPANYNIGLGKTSASSGVVWDNGVYTASDSAQTQFAVTSYTFNNTTSSDDRASLYLNPSPATFGGAVPTTGTILSTINGSDVTGTLQTFLLRQGTQAAAPQGIVFDELRIGTTWFDVTPPQATSSTSQPGPIPGGPVATASLADFQPFTYTDPDGNLMPYRLFVPPNYDPQRKYPLVVWLHGAGEVGTNNTGPASHVVAHRLAAHAKDSEYSSFVLVPQTFDYWGPRAQSSVLDIMAQLENQFSIDINREYLSGISLGGYGVWDFIANYPEKFAAAVPVAGGGWPGYADLIKDIPIWAYHSFADELVPVSESREMITAIRAAGGHPRYTEYPFGTHGSSFNDTYSEPQLYDWMYAQALPEPRTACSSGFLIILTLLLRPQKRSAA
jgi:acetyl esterase/lipase